MTSSSSCDTRLMCTPDAECNHEHREQHFGLWEAWGLTHPHTPSPQPTHGWEWHSVYTHPSAHPWLRMALRTHSPLRPPMVEGGTRPRWATRGGRSRSSVSKTGWRADRCRRGKVSFYITVTPSEGRLTCLPPCPLLPPRHPPPGVTNGVIANIIVISEYCHLPWTSVKLWVALLTPNVLLVNSSIGTVEMCVQHCCQQWTWWWWWWWYMWSGDSPALNYKELHISFVRHKSDLHKLFSFFNQFGQDNET